MSHKCPKCGSDQTANIKVAAARESQSGAFGGAGLSGEGVGVFGGASRATSDFGRSLAYREFVSVDEKPLNGPINCMAIAFVAGLIVLINMGVNARRVTVGWKLAFVACVVVGLIGLIWAMAVNGYNSSRKEANEARRLAARRKHDAQWVCYQCGERFTPTKVV